MRNSSFTSASRISPGGGILAARVLALLLLTVCSATQALSQTQPAVVSGSLLIETDGVHAGAVVKAAFVGEVAPGYHINDHVPSLDYLIPTELKIESSPPISAGVVVYPKGAPRKFEFLDKPISVYQGKLALGADLRVAADARPGDYTLKGAFNYQACTEHACLAPASLPLTLAIKVVPKSQSVKRVNSDAFSGTKPR